MKISVSAASALESIIAAKSEATEPLSEILAALCGAEYCSAELPAYCPINQQSQEIYEVNPARFDCVTLVETALALLNAGDISEFKAHLISLRYARKPYSWQNRNHYFSDWLSQNQDKGYVRIINPDGTPPLSGHPKTLDCLPNYKSVSVCLELFPQSALLEYCSNKPMIFSAASLRDNLDYYHVGIISGDKLWHASRSQKMVLSETISAFLERNQSLGFSLAEILKS